MHVSPCPTCKKPVAAEESDRPATYPFCSRRCKLVDLGRWFDEQYRISTPLESSAEIERLIEKELGEADVPPTNQPDEPREAGDQK